MLDFRKPWLSVYEDKVPVRIIESSLPDFLADGVAKHRDHVAMTAGKRRMTYGELGEQIDKFASALARAGVSKGDSVGVMSANSLEYVMAFFGVMRTGAVVTQINPLYVDRELSHILTDSDSTLVVADAAVYDKVKQVQDRTPVKQLIATGMPKGLAEPDLSFEQFIASGAGAPPEVDIDYRKELAVLQYTGGTAGVSKGAIHTHRTLLSAVQPTYDLLIENVKPEARSR